MAAIHEGEPRVENLLAGYIAIVTGGASGIGKAVVTEFLKQKAFVAILDIDESALQQTINEVSGLGNVMSVVADITNREGIEDAVKKIESEWGHVNLLVNSAGIMILRPLENFPEEEWEQVLRTDLSGAINCTQAIGRRMIETKTKGNIINITSTHAIVVYPQSGPYDVAKAGLFQYTRLAATEWGKYGIRVNSIAPGHIPGTRMNPIENKNIPEVIASIPLGRAGIPNEVARVALFLASDYFSSYLTGVQLVVDGGQTIHAPLNQPLT